MDGGGLSLRRSLLRSTVALALALAIAGSAAACRGGGNATPSPTATAAPPATPTASATTVAVTSLHDVNFEDPALAGPLINRAGGGEVHENRVRFADLIGGDGVDEAVVIVDWAARRGRSVRASSGSRADAPRSSSSCATRAGSTFARTWS